MEHDLGIGDSLISNPFSESRTHRRRIITKRMADKLVKALNARTPEGRYNYVVDAFAEEHMHDQVLDSLLHGLVEVCFRKGPLDRRLQNYIRKTLRYRA